MDPFTIAAIAKGVEVLGSAVSGAISKKKEKKLEKKRIEEIERERKSDTLAKTLDRDSETFKRKERAQSKNASSKADVIRNTAASLR